MSFVLLVRVCRYVNELSVVAEKPLGGPDEEVSLR